MIRVCLLAALAVGALPAGGGVDPEVAVVVDSVIGSAYDPELRWPDISDLESTLREVYAEEPDRLFWFAGAVPDPSVPAVVKGLALADEQGLGRANYDADWLMQRWREISSGHSTPAQRALFDLALTVNVARLVTAVHGGRIDPATLQWGYDRAPRTLDRAKVLREVRLVGDLAHALPALEPPFPHYARARQLMARYRAAAAAGEPPLVSDLPRDQPKVEPGQQWAGVGQLAARLRVLGDLPADAKAPPAGAPYGGPLVDAVKRFQRRHGLEADGVIGPGTVSAVNVPLSRRVRQIELAMERMRWLPEMEKPVVFVNVALFRLWATDPVTGEEPLRMRVVVGQSLEHQTPLFVDRMEYVVFRPYWNPPPGITSKELVPHIRRDSGYMARENLEVVAAGGDDDAPALPATPENLGKVLSGQLTLRQKPGPKNALGLAKFIFPNSANVYMHGTPAQSLFSRARRDFSHGCIRLEDPSRLAEWVLRDQPEWTRDKILEAMQGRRPTRVALKEPLTVVLFYDTVHVDSEGVAYFVDDIYGDDAQLEAAIERGYPYPSGVLK